MNGKWTSQQSGIGAGIDSFYEYLLKSYMLFDDEELFRIFQMSYQAVNTYMKKEGWYFEVNMYNGQPTKDWIESLQAFWPAVQVLHGDLSNAIELHHKLYSIWRWSGFLPEAFSLRTFTPVPWFGGYPLRPEFVESTFFLYRATKDHHYLEVGREILRNLQNYTRVQCGFASIADVDTKRLEDRMDSYFLSETLKYLYLLFDEQNPFNSGDYLFTTEGHMFPFSFRNISSPSNAFSFGPFASFSSSYEQRQMESEEDSCNGPLSLILPTALKEKSSLTETTLLEEKVPVASLKHQQEHCKASHLKLVGTYPDDRKTQNTEGWQHILRDRFGTEFIPNHSIERFPLVVLRIKNSSLIRGDFYGSPAAFGKEFNITGITGKLVYTQPADSCSPLRNGEDIRNNIALMDRGSCLFAEKVRNAQRAGCTAAVIVNHQLSPLFTMSSDISDILQQNDMDTNIVIPSTMISLKDGQSLKRYLDSTNAIFVELFALEPYDIKELTKSFAPLWTIQLQIPSGFSTLLEEEVTKWIISKISNTETDRNITFLDQELSSQKDYGLQNEEMKPSD